MHEMIKDGRDVPEYIGFARDIGTILNHEGDQ